MLVLALVVVVVVVVVVLIVVLGVVAVVVVGVVVVVVVPEVAVLSGVPQAELNAKEAMAAPPTTRLASFRNWRLVTGCDSFAPLLPQLLLLFSLDIALHPYMRIIKYNTG